MEQRKRAGPSHEEDQQPQRDAKRGKSISVSGLRSVYGKITTFPKKERAYARWRAGEKFGEIARNALCRRGNSRRLCHRHNCQWCGEPRSSSQAHQRAQDPRRVL
ncbi:hypothetical protein OS493_016800 [Desmophyllum pertusum]|uniref:Uncharacterized protein n=1 Tax=Desmophyllum pertusum TaxID=174260 RepID=A0A9W9Z061_9CNID|nr:hypothetical protein OS493_016800 [Desmophyllum pertusum]